MESSHWETVELFFRDRMSSALADLSDLQVSSDRIRQAQGAYKALESLRNDLVALAKEEPIADFGDSNETLTQGDEE